MISTKTYSWILIVCGIIGVLAAMMLTIDTIKVLEDPLVELPCNINPLISCGPIMNTEQSRAFGFPNPILGIAGFAFILMTGIMLSFKAEPENKFWNLFLLGVSAQIIFVHWLFYQSVFIIGNLCLYCMITWAVSWPVFFYSLKHKISETSIIYRHHHSFFVAWYLLIILIILFQFRDFFFN